MLRAMRWKREDDGTPVNDALLTGSSSIHHALRCALAIAEQREEYVGAQGKGGGPAKFARGSSPRPRGASSGAGGRGAV